MNHVNLRYAITLMFLCVCHYVIKLYYHCYLMHVNEQLKFIILYHMLQLRVCIRHMHRLIVHNCTVYTLLFVFVIISLSKIYYNCRKDVSKYVYNYIIVISYLWITLHCFYNYLYTCYIMINF